MFQDEQGTSSCLFGLHSCCFSRYISKTLLKNISLLIFIIFYSAGRSDENSNKNLQNNQDKLQTKEMKEVKDKTGEKGARKEKGAKSSRKEKGVKSSRKEKGAKSSRKEKGAKSSRKEKEAKSSRKEKSLKSVKKEKAGKTTRKEKADKSTRKEKAGKTSKKEKAARKEKTDKQGGRKSSRKVQQKAVRQTTCSSDEECLTLATKYLKTIKDKVVNFNAQKARIEKSGKLALSKAGKKGDFTTDLSNLKDVGGGNTSALTCQGNSNGTGQAALKDAVDKLTACQDSIKAACETGLPPYNQTAADACATKMATLSALADNCTKITDSTKVCACWKSVALKTASDAIANCSLTTENSNYTKFKNTCTSSFSTCRQTQDLTSSVIYSCSSVNSPDKLLAKLKDVTDNKASIDKLTTTANSKATGARMKRAASCADFITACKKVADLALNAIFSPDVKKMADAANADPPTLCTAAEKDILKTAVTSLGKASTAASAAIATVQSSLEGKVFLLTNSY